MKSATGSPAPLSAEHVDLDDFVLYATTVAASAEQDAAARMYHEGFRRDQAITLAGGRIVDKRELAPTFDRIETTAVIRVRDLLLYLEHEAGKRPIDAASELTRTLSRNGIRGPTAAAAERLLADFRTQ